MEGLWLPPLMALTTPRPRPPPSPLWALRSPPPVLLTSISPAYSRFAHFLVVNPMYQAIRLASVAGWYSPLPVPSSQSAWLLGSAPNAGDPYSGLAPFLGMASALSIHRPMCSPPPPPNLTPLADSSCRPKPTPLANTSCSPDPDPSDKPTPPANPTPPADSTRLPDPT